MHTTVRSAAIACAFALATTIGAAATSATTGAEPHAGVSVIDHRTEPLPGMGRLHLQIWHDGETIQVIGLDEQGAIVLAREGTLDSEPTLEGTGALRGIRPAGTLRVQADNTASHQRCATERCAHENAILAESLVRAATMGVATAPGEASMMSRICPVPDGGARSGVAPSPALAALARRAPCRWVPLANADVAALPGVGRQVRVQIGTTVYHFRQARWLIGAGGV